MKSIKVPKPRQLPSGSWFVRVTVDGQRYPITEATEELCVARAMAIKQELLSPVDRTAKPTLSKAIDLYIERRQNILSPATIRGYRTMQRNRFQSAMHRPVDAFSEPGWQRLINIEAKLVSAKTLHNAWGLVSPILQEYAGTKYRVQLPQTISNTRSFLSWKQIPDFIQCITDTPYEIPALLALHSLRCSEILALTWENIDLERSMIYVQGAIVPDENNKRIYKKENKNKTSRRSVPIMIPELKEALQKEEQKTGRVVRRSESAIRNGINKICENNGFPTVGIHGLRHSFASLAYHLNMPEKIAMQIGGWENDATMRKIYTHVSQEDVLLYQNAMTSFYSSKKE